MVITFLPYPNFKQSLKCLDKSRLNKQILEARQIYNALVAKKESKNVAWSNHPAAKMWEGYLPSLALYHNTARATMKELYGSAQGEDINTESDAELPPWFGNMIVHYSHQASLIRKHPHYYEKIFSDLPAVYREHGYVWPLNMPNSKQINKKEVPKFYYQDLVFDSLSPPSHVFAPINQTSSRFSHLSEFRNYTLSQLREMAAKNGVDIKLNKKELYLILFKKQTLEEARQTIEDGFFSPSETTTKKQKEPTIKELREILKSKNYKGISKLKKSELLELLNKSKNV